MASHKNQHFVPRCYLKPFTFNGEGVAINLFNIDRLNSIENVPVKNQCSSNYFYGENLLIEKRLQKIEGDYAACLNQILKIGYKLTDSHRELLRNFCLLQHLRTEASSRRAMAMHIDMAETIGIPAEERRATMRELVELSMDIFVESVSIVSDLKVCLIRNRTNTPFITSDDPAVLTNKWHLQDVRALGVSPGMASAGALFFLPLSPEILCIVYDGGVYSIPHNNGWTETRRVNDILAYNEHQYLNCKANIYFKEWSLRDQVASDFSIISSFRPLSRHRTTYAILDKSIDGYERYKVVEKVNAEEHERALIHSQTILPIPQRWPLQLTWRKDGAIFTNGTGRGFIRRQGLESLGKSGFKKLKVCI